MKILISMLHVVNHGGAAMVMLEFAEQFRHQGHDVDICTWWSGSPMHDYFQKAGVRRLENIASVNPFDYDIVFFLHQNAPMHFPKIKTGQKNKTLILFFRLSHSSNIGVPSAILDDLIMDKTFVNSEEVKLRMNNEFGLPDACLEVFGNASPDHYALPSITTPRSLGKVLYVSNHNNKAVVGALKILKESYGLDVLHVGEGGDCQRRVTAELIHGFDVVITMAKTAQYALLARKPIYVYDYHWGGPGYITSENFQKVSDYNFSGSYKPFHRSSKVIASEIVNGYSEASAFANQLPDSEISKYKLSSIINRIFKLYELAEPNEIKLKRLMDNKFRLWRERCSVEQFYNQYRKARSSGNKLSSIRRILG